MLFEKRYKSKLGYSVGEDDAIDSYGVDHSGFTTRDEVAYQTARNDRENDLIENYNKRGITDNYPQYGRNFWGSSPENNYGFGSSNITDNIETVKNRFNTSGAENGYNQFFNYNNADNYQNAATETPSSDVWSQQKLRSAENDLLMDGLDTLYGMNRAVNGMTFGRLDWLGNKSGIDTQMQDYLKLKNSEERDLVQTAGNIADYGGSVLTGGVLAKAGLNQANIAYNGYKIGKKYDKLKQDPFQGSGTDVIDKMKNHNGDPVILQRGEAIRGQDGNIIVGGKYLKENTGSKSNYGLNKGIYKHGVSRADAKRIPRILQQKPFDTNNYGQNEYIAQSKSGPFRVVTSPKDKGNIIATMYYVDK